jgi:hypothetical protein
MRGSGSRCDGFGRRDRPVRSPEVGLGCTDRPASSPVWPPRLECRLLWPARKTEHLIICISLSLNIVCAPSLFVEKDLYILSTSEYGLRVLSI